MCVCVCVTLCSNQTFKQDTVKPACAQHVHGGHSAAAWIDCGTLIRSAPTGSTSCEAGSCTTVLHTVADIRSKVHCCRYTSSSDSRVARINGCVGNAVLPRARAPCPCPQACSPGGLQAQRKLYPVQTRLGFGGTENLTDSLTDCRRAYRTLYRRKKKKKKAFPGFLTQEKTRKAFPSWGLARI